MCTPAHARVYDCEQMHPVCTHVYVRAGLCACVHAYVCVCVGPSVLGLCTTQG